MDVDPAKDEAPILAMRALRALKRDRRTVYRPEADHEIHRITRQRYLSNLRPINVSASEAEDIRKNVLPVPPSIAFCLEEKDDHETLEPYDPLAPQPEPPDLDERRDFWRKTFSRANLPLKELAPYRVRIAWRFIRELLRVCNVCQGEPLSELTPSLELPDPWTTARHYMSTRTPRGLVQAHTLVTIFRAASEIPREHTAEGYAGLSLLPPEVPARYLDAYDQIRPDYDPTNRDHDPALNYYCDALREVSRYLNFTSGSIKEPHQGSLGLYGLLNPKLVRMVFPTRGEIMAWESILVGQTLGELVKMGQILTRNWLFENYGLKDVEAQEIINQAKSESQKLTSGSADEDRSLMLLRLEDVGHRARESGNIREELNALKQTAVLKGFSRSEPEDILADFARVVDRVAEESEAKEVEGSVVKQIELDEGQAAAG